MKNLFAILFLALLMAGCSSETDMIRAPKDAQPVNKFGLTLNEGQRWRANEETTAGIEGMQLTLERFGSENELGSLEAYQQLGRDLNGELNAVFMECTMTGAAHDELHKFIEPVLAEIKTLKGDNLDASTAAYNRLREHLTLYKEFFE